MTLPVHVADLRLLGNSGSSCNLEYQPQHKQLISSAHDWRGIHWCRECRHILSFSLLGFRDISLFLVGDCYNLISLTQTVQCRKLPALVWPTILEEATSGSAFLQLCKAFLSFRYSLQGTTLKHSRNSESTTRLCCTSTAAAVSAALPLAPSPWSLANPGELSPQQLMEEGSHGPPQWSRDLDTRVSSPLPTRASSMVRHLLARHLPEHGVEVEELPPKIRAAPNLRQRQMSLTFTVFQELNSLSSLPLTGEIAQNLFSLQSLPRGKKTPASMQVYLFCVFLILYFTNQCQLSVIESRHSC